MSGYNAANEPILWWKVAHHLDETQLALVNALAHNVDDPGPIHALHDRLREGQAILLEIFRLKGLLPGSTNGVHEPSLPTEGEGPVVSMIAPDEPAVSEADHAAVSADPAAASPEAAPPEGVGG